MKDPCLAWLSNRQLLLKGSSLLNDKKKEFVKHLMSTHEVLAEKCENTICKNCILN